MEKKVLIVGNNVDKGKLDEVMTRVSRDPDLNRLIRKGKYSIGIKFGEFIFSIVSFGCGLEKDDYFFQWTCIGIILFITSMYSIINDIQELKEKSMKFYKYISYMFSKSCPRTPLDIWRFIQGSVADIQMLNTCEQINKEKFDVIYAGLPYYETIYIDSIVLKWNHSGCKVVRFFKEIARYWSYRKFFKKYSEQTIIAKADKKYFKQENKQIECSNAGFGVLFFSQYIKNELLRRAVKHDRKINIKINITNESDGKSAEKKKYIKQWLQYCTSPDCFTIDKEGCQDSLFEVVAVLTEQDKRKKKQFFHRIPVKKFIAYAVCDNINSDYPLPQKYIKRKEDNHYKFYCVGGAEQNIALQCIVNHYKWKGNGDFKIGFAENAFEDVYDDGFLIGTEGLVYGIRTNPIGRFIPKQESSCKAEVYRLLWQNAMNNIELYGIYGYSAMATKMALCRFMYSVSKLEKDEDKSLQCDKIEKCIPGKHIEKVELIDYVVSGTPDNSVYKTKEGKRWDERDYMNNVQEMRKYLSKNDTIGPNQQ